MLKLISGDELYSQLAHFFRYASDRLPGLVPDPVNQLLIDPTRELVTALLRLIG